MATAATGSQVLSTLTMISYALGYTAVIFLANLFAGLVKYCEGFVEQFCVSDAFGCCADCGRSLLFTYCYSLVFFTNLSDLTQSPDEIFTKTLTNPAGICDLLKIKNSRSTRLDT
jgi:hypothetical protein